MESAMSALRGEPSLPATPDLVETGRTRANARDNAPARPAARVAALAGWFRQGVNIALAALALIVLSPLLLVIGLLVKLTSRGPVF